MVQHYSNLYCWENWLTFVQAPRAEAKLDVPENLQAAEILEVCGVVWTVCCFLASLFVLDKRE